MNDTPAPLSDIEQAIIADRAALDIPAMSDAPISLSTLNRLLATIAARDETIANLTVVRDHPMADPEKDEIPDNDPKVLAELAALPVEKLCERLRGVYALWEGVVPRRYYTGAISHEAARRIEELAALRANGTDVTRAEIANWYRHLFYGQTSDNNFPDVFINKFAGRRIGHE